MLQLKAGLVGTKAGFTVDRNLLSPVEFTGTLPNSPSGIHIEPGMRFSFTSDASLTSRS